MIVPCECGAKLRIDDAKIVGREVRVRCPRCANILVIPAMQAQAAEAPRPGPQEGGGPLIVVAHDSEVVREMVAGVLLDAGFRVRHAADGMQALEAVRPIVPSAMVIDVGLPGIYGFELCERLRNDPETSGIKIVLLASVYGITRYKRTPTSLYGADDYIEKHHIADALVNKINRLLAGEQRKQDATPRDHAHAHPAHGREAFFSPETLAMGETDQRPSGAGAPGAASPPGAAHAIQPDAFSLESSIFEREEVNIPMVEETDPEAVEKAKRFARIIVSDIALYNQEAVIKGIKEGTFYDLLKGDIEEGRQLYEERVPAAVRSKRDHYRETIDNFIAAQKKIVH